MLILSKKTYISVLLGKFISDLTDKQTVLETYLNQTVAYSGLDQSDLEDLCLFTFYSVLKSINWLNFSGKTYFTKFFKLIKLEAFIDYILIDYFTKLKFIIIESKSYLRDLLLNLILVYFKKNFIKFNLLDIERTCAYFIEIIVGESLIIYDFSSKTYNLNNKIISFKPEYLCTIVKYNWPLIIPAKNYEKNNDNQYFGGYYTNLISLNTSHIFDNKPATFIDTSLNFIHKLQHSKFILIQNIFIKDLIFDYYNYLLQKLNQNNDLNLLNNFYVCYQYLTFIEGNVIEIYYPFQFDSLGKITTAVSFGLNPYKNKLSTLLVGLGRSFLNDSTRMDYENFIINSLNSDLKLLNLPLITSLTELNISLVLKNFNTYSIESLILLTDWFYNVLPFNFTEITRKFQMFDNNFQILGLLSNDIQNFTNTNSYNNNIYNFLLEKLEEEFTKKNYINWIKFFNSEFLHTLVDIIPYFNSVTTCLSMLSQSFIKIFIKNNKFNLDTLILFCSSNILKDIVLIDNVLHQLNFIKNHFKNIDLQKNEIQIQINFFIKQNYNDLMLDLSSYFLKEITSILLIIITKYFFNVVHFINFIYKLNLTHMITKYLNLDLQYLSLEKNEFKINNGTYISYIKTDTINLELTQTNLIFNICKIYQYFIIQDIIYNSNIPLYFIDNYFFYKIDDLDILKTQVLKSYDFVFNYHYNYFKSFFETNSNKLIK
jgi:hypothetical protein